MADSRPITRNAVIDAAARVVARRGDHRMRWSAIAYEAGNEQAVLAASWFEDSNALIDECYARTAQAFAEALLRGETAPGTALDKVAAFLVAALELRRERGSLLSFRRGRDLPTALQRRLHEWDQMLRTRLKRMLTKGRRDGSLALRNLDSACELILASLMVPDVAVDGPEQRMWDSELVELLLAALSEPHPPEGIQRKSVAVATGSCLCGTVRYEIEGPFEVTSHCHCSMCRKHHGAALATFVTIPLSGFRWVAGEDTLSTFQSSAYGKRTFCSKCGSVMPAVEPDTGVAFCPAGNLDGELGIQAQGHRFVGSKASRQTLSDTLPQHEEV
jgi:DNA-binding transcriptional regulator YbjK